MVEMVQSANKFLSQYESYNTKKGYKVALTQFFTLVYPELAELKDREERWLRLNELSVRYFSEERDPREDVVAYRDWMIGREFAPKSKVSRLAGIFRFFEDNEQGFNKNWKKNIIGKAKDAITEERVPTKAQFMSIIEHLPLQGKTMAVVLASSGMRIGEAVQIKLENLNLDHNPPRIKIPLKITKTKKKRTTFIDPDARGLIEEWLKFRPEYIKQANKRGAYLRNSLTPENDPRLFPFTAQTFQVQWRRALEKAKLLELDNGRVTIRPHNLRKYFRTRGDWKNSDYPKALMGHQEGMDAIYARYDQTEEELAKEYLRVIPSLSIYTTTKTIVELRDQIDEQESVVNQTVAQLNLENTEMKREIEGLKEMIADLQTQFDWDTLREKLEGVIDPKKLYEPVE